jgi:hypothetical protein
MSDPLLNSLAHGLCDELDAAFGRIKHCVRQLTDEQVWWRPRTDMNAIGNLILHLGGNVKQFVMSVVGGEADDRDRPAEFAARSAIPGSQLVERLESIVNRAKAVIAAASAEEMCRVRAVRGENWSGIQTLIRSVSHFRGHAQEIIHQTREILGDRYEYAGMK